MGKIVADGSDTASSSSTLLSQTEGEKLDNLDQTLWDLFTTTVSERPDHDALVSMWQSDQHDEEEDSSKDQLVNNIPPGGLGAIHFPTVPVPESAAGGGSSSGTPTGKPKYIRWSYRELHRRTVVLSSWLSARGCRPQDRIAAFLWNSAEWGLFFWASAKLGLVYMPLDPRLLATPSDGEYLVESTRPRVVVAQDAAEAAVLDTLLHVASTTSSTIIRIQCSGFVALPGWTHLREIMAAAASSTQPVVVHSDPPAPSNPNSVALIIFTSGTTSRPKGCLHTHRNLLAQMHTYDPNPDPPSHTDRWLVHTPSCHIFAVNNALRAFKLGHAVIFPSRTFDISATLAALVDEQCTVMSAVPALVKALLANADFPGREKLDLRLVTIGGTLITPEDIRLCREGLGARHAVQAFGMSEGAPVISWNRDDPLLALNDGYHPGVGRALPGANIRICRPDSRDVVERGCVGELHIGGEQIVSTGYIGDDVAVEESFYEDEVGRWLVTGDQARMDDHGVVYILGRYKDLIIRAGENLSPVKMEGVIGEVDGVQLAQVVGVADDFAGQVPVAVVSVSAKNDMLKAQIIAKCRELGPMFALDGVYFLAELDMETFPVTSLGKIKKEVLRKAVEERRRRPAEKLHVVKSDFDKGETTSLPESTQQIEEDPDKTDSVSAIADRLASIWEGLIGQKPGLDDSVAAFADSITILRFCDRVLNALDERLYLQDFVDHDTVAKQAVLLRRRARGEIADLSYSFPSFSETPPSTAGTSLPQPLPKATNGENPVNNCLPAVFRASTFSQAPKSLSDQESEMYSVAVQAAVNIDFPASDIEDVLPIRENYLRLAIGTRPQSYHIRTLMRISPSYTPGQIRQALEAGLTARSIFRTFLVQLPNDGGTPFHVILRPSTSLFDNLIQTLTVPDQATKDALTKDGSSAFHSAPWMAQFQIISVSNSEETILSATYNHSIVDAMSILPWHLDLERLLVRVRQPTLSSNLLPPSTPFQPFSELYHLYKTSLPARISVEYTVSRLRGISRFPSALWPVQRSPGWMISDDGCPAPLAATRNSTREKLWGGKWASHYAAEFHSLPRVGRNISLSTKNGGIEWLRGTKKIEPSLVMKCAIALLNILQTGCEYAIFNTIHAGRSWPFVPAWMERMLPPPMSIVGPTTEWSLELCRVDAKNETVGTLLSRMKDEHEMLERHCHVPWVDVLRGLGGGEESRVAEDATFRQAFVWDVSIGLGLAGGLDPAPGGRRDKKKKEKAMEVVGRYDWPDCGLFWNAFMVDRTNLFFIANWDTAQMNLDEVEGHCNTLAGILRQLVKEENWDRKVCEVFN